MKRFPKGIAAILACLLAAGGLLAGFHLSGGDLPGVCFNRPGDGIFRIGLWNLEESGGVIRLSPRGNGPVLSAEDVTDRPARYVADPFVVRGENGYFLFFEILGVDRGVIGLATSLDGHAWRYERVVLEEPFHLSYPFVFAEDGGWYMVPESGAAGEVRLYRANPFPGTWAYVRTLVTGRRFADPTLLKDKGRWWLFAGDAQKPALYLYHAETLSGPWTPHPGNPIVRDRTGIPRPAGNVLRLGARLIRVAQGDAGGYGSSVHGFEIRELSPTRYRETALPENPLLQASGTGWNSHGMHQLSAVPDSSGRLLAAVDGKQETGQFTLCIGRSIFRIP